MKSKKIYTILWTVSALIGTVLTITSHTEVSAALYFTCWTAWLGFASAASQLILALMGKQCRFVRGMTFCAAIMAVATFIVAAFVLPTKIWTAGYWSASGTFNHFITPILTILFIVLVEDRNSLGRLYPVWADLTCLLYWVVVIVRFVTFRNASGGAIPEALQAHYYPYGFTNLDAGHTLGGLIGLLAGILVGLTLIGYAIVAWNHRKK